MRFFLTIEYDGSEYIGWQRQNSGLSVQEVVENSIYKIIQINLNIYGSGRTDAGVHATGQVAHVDIKTKDSFLIDTTNLSEKAVLDLAITILKKNTEIIK